MKPRFRTLRNQLLLWVSAPLLALWVISTIIDHDIATAFVNLNYDRALLDTARALLQAMIANAPLALAGCIEAVDRGLDVSLEEGCHIESDFFGLLSSTADMKEGMRAFLDKRPPTFTGR